MRQITRDEMICGKLYAVYDSCSNYLSIYSPYVGIPAVKLVGHWYCRRANQQNRKYMRRLWLELTDEETMEHVILETI